MKPLPSPGSCFHGWWPPVIPPLVANVYVTNLLIDGFTPWSCGMRTSPQLKRSVGRARAVGVYSHFQRSRSLIANTIDMNLLRHLQCGMAVALLASCNQMHTAVSL